MKKIKKKELIITSIICLLPIIIGLFFYSELPNQIAIHFGTNNEADSYFLKPYFVFGTPLMMMVLQIICCVSSDIKNENEAANKKAVTVYKWIIPILSFIMYSISILYSLGYNIDIRKVVMIIIGIVCIVIGNYLPKTVGSLRIHIFNYTKNFQKSISKKYGYLLVINGFLFIASILCDEIVSIALVILLLAETIILYIYTLIKSKKTHTN